MNPAMTTGQPWPWPQAMDALLAAPGSHRLVLDNDRVRVLEAVIEPGAREPATCSVNSAETEGQIRSQ